MCVRLKPLIPNLQTLEAKVEGSRRRFGLRPVGVRISCRYLRWFPSILGREGYRRSASWRANVRRHCARERRGRRRAVFPTQFHAAIAVFHRGSWLPAPNVRVVQREAWDPSTVVPVAVGHVLLRRTSSRAGRPIEPFPKPAPMRITWRTRGWRNFLSSGHGHRLNRFRYGNSCYFPQTGRAYRVAVVSNGIVYKSS